MVMYEINSRQLVASAPLSSELKYEPTKNYLFDLSYLRCLRLLGERAQEFIQGQISCDVREVSIKQMRQGAFCNLKGRVLALLDVLNCNGNSIDLILPNDLLADTQVSLAKTAMFSRVSLRQVNDYQILGFYLQNDNDTIPFDLKLTNAPYEVISSEKYCCYCLGRGFYIFLVMAEEFENVRERFREKSQWKGSLAWHALQLQQKRIEIYPESRGMFLPHRLGLQLSGYLSFNKGCYKGQEIIARTHYRAKLKHELKVFTIETCEPLRSGLKVFSNTIEIGELVDFCPIGEGRFIISISVLFEHPSEVLIEGHEVPVKLGK
jgi:tRNA-modifying protein YgfZ